MIISQYNDQSGYIRLLWQMADGSSLQLKFREQPTEERLLQIESDYLARQAIDTLPVVGIDIFENKTLIIEVVTKIKQNPSLTLTQYNSYLSSKPWYEAATIRYFIFSLATGLARHYGIDMTTLTEGTVLGKVRNWIVETPAQKLSKIIFNDPNAYLS